MKLFEKEEAMEGPIILKFEDCHIRLENKEGREPVDPEDRAFIIQLPDCSLEADDTSEEVDPDYFDGGIDF